MIVAISGVAAVAHSVGSAIAAVAT
jgi:hypothetical protein